MKKLLIFFISLLLLSGCSKSIDKKDQAKAMLMYNNIALYENYINTGNKDVTKFNNEEISKFRDRLNSEKYISNKIIDSMAKDSDSEKYKLFKNINETYTILYNITDKLIQEGYLVPIEEVNSVLKEVTSKQNETEKLFKKLNFDSKIEKLKIDNKKDYEEILGLIILDNMQYGNSLSSGGTDNELKKNLFPVLKQNTNCNIMILNSMKETTSNNTDLNIILHLLECNKNMVQCINQIEKNSNSSTTAILSGNELGKAVSLYNEKYN